MRRCLIVSPHFPPSTLAGVHRARHLSKYLPSHGWMPTVVCVDPRYHVEQLDPDLAKLMPSTAAVVYTRAIPAALTRPIGLVGEIGLRGFFHLWAAIARLIEEQRPEVVLITGSPFYPMLLSGWIQRKFGVPVVLDFQDPWVPNCDVAAQRWTKAWLSHRLAIWLEPFAVRGASWITSVSDRQNEELSARYPELNRDHMRAIPIGGDPDDFAFLRGLVLSAPQSTSFTFAYVGTALPRSTPLLEALFGGLAKLRQQKPELAKRIRLRFVGTSNQPGGYRDFRVTALAQAAGVADLVCEEPARVPYLEALRILATTDAILMIGSDEPHYTASKIYPCLMSGRPFLSLFHPDSSAHQILTNAGGGIALPFDSNRPKSLLQNAIADALECLISGKGFVEKANPETYANYSADRVARQFADVFEQLID